MIKAAGLRVVNKKRFAIGMATSFVGVNVVTYVGVKAFSLVMVRLVEIIKYIF